MSVILSDNGFSRMKIRILPSAGRVERFAAHELAAYLFQISGAGFSIMEGMTPFKGEILLVAAGDGQEDACTLSVKKDSIRITGSNPRSVLYGVYALLEKAGCIFFDPYQEYIPKKPTLEMEEFEETSRAGFRIRSVFQAFNLYRKEYQFDGFVPVRRLPQIAYLAKNRFNTCIFSCEYNRLDLWDKNKFQIMDAVLDRGLRMEFISSTLEYFCPDCPANDFGEYGSSTYITERPQWYVNGHLNVTLPEVMELVAERYSGYLLTHPEFSSVTLSPLKQSVETVPAKKGKSMDAWMSFFNGVADRLAKLCPGRMLSVMLHNGLLDLAKASAKPAANIRFIVRNDGCMNYHYPVSSKVNAQWKAQIAALCRWGNPLTVIDGTGESADLTPFWESAAELYCFYRKAGAEGVYEFGGHSYNMLGTGFRRRADYFCCGRYLWGTSSAPEKVLRFWADGMYGPGGKKIAAFYRKMADFHKKTVKNKVFGATEKWLELSVFRSVQKELAAAVKTLPDTAEGKIIAERISKIEIFVAHSSSYLGTDEFAALNEFMR